MSQHTSEHAQLSAETASIEDAYLAIPDDLNPAIWDAKKTFWSTIVGAILFIGTVFVFIL